MVGLVLLMRCDARLNRRRVSTAICVCRRALSLFLLLNLLLSILCIMV